VEWLTQSEDLVLLLPVPEAGKWLCAVGGRHQLDGRSTPVPKLPNRPATEVVMTTRPYCRSVRCGHAAWVSRKEPSRWTGSRAPVARFIGEVSTGPRGRYGGTGRAEEVGMARSRAAANSANSAPRDTSQAQADMVRDDTGKDDTVLAADGTASGPASGNGPLPDRGEELVRLLKLSERREPLVVQVATWVGLGVIEGRLRPGQDLNSVDLSHRFKTSRTPVREALMLLEQEGLVEIRARRRPRVAEYTPEAVRQIYEVREHLLALVGRLVAANATSANLDDLRQRVTVMRGQADSGNVDGYFWSHVALQERMTVIAGNATLKGILDSLALRTLILRHASLEKPGRLPHSVAAQEQILEAIEAHDADLAAMLLSRATRAALASIMQSPWSQNWIDPGEPGDAEPDVPAQSKPKNSAGLRTSIR
jgi:DNA-binding GntR family transcriptional regulator